MIEQQPSTADGDRGLNSATSAGAPPGEHTLADVRGVLAGAVQKIRRRYPDAAVAYLLHPNDGRDESRVVLSNIQDESRVVLWPDAQGEVFQDVSGRGERFWLGERDGEPYAELAEVNRLLTDAYRRVGSTLFEKGELTGGWFLPLDAAIKK